MLCIYHLPNFGIDEFVEKLYKNDFGVILGHE